MLYDTTRWVSEPWVIRRTHTRQREGWTKTHTLIQFHLNKTPRKKKNRNVGRSEIRDVEAKGCSQGGLLQGKLA